MTLTETIMAMGSDFWGYYKLLWANWWPLMLLLHIYLLIQVTWVHYLAVMNLARNRRKLTPFSRYWAYSVLAIGYPLDILFNLTFGTLFFLELPRETLFTSRCNRHIDEAGWRGALARWFCRNMLDPFDPRGSHCDRSIQTQES